MGLQVSAQKKSISGVVRMAGGETLIGVTILEKGTFNGVATDLDGKFLIPLTGDGGVLVFSMIGFKTLEVKIGNQTKLEVIMHEESTGLDEVVVIGYGTQKKVSVIGSITTMSSEELKRSPVASVTNGMSGRMPGVVTQQQSGRPGEDAANIFIRGRSTLASGNTSPLVLVDGVERDFAQMDPDEIESISVLKDASATAVYGVRGSNGVVLVTTKRGTEGKAKITFSAECGITEAMRLPDKVDSWQHAVMKNEGLKNEGKAPQYSERDIYMYASGEDPFLYPNTDYTDQFLRPGIQQKYNVNMSGGSKMMKYFVSVGYLKQEGIFETDMDKLMDKSTFKELLMAESGLRERIKKKPYESGHGFDRLNVRSNIDIDVTADFKVGVDLGYRREILTGPGGDGESVAYLYGVFGRTPKGAFPLVNRNGTFAAAPNLVNANPLVTMANSGYRNQYKNALEGTVKLNYDLHQLLQGLKIDGKFSYNTYSHSARIVNHTPSVWTYDAANDYYLRLREEGYPRSGSSKKAAEQRTYGELSLTYNGDFDKHKLGVLILGNINSNLKPGDANKNSEYGNIPHIYQGLVGRINYSYDDRLLAEINVGYNGSNRFEKGERYALFPALSVGWMVSNEKFLKDNKTLNHLKLKASVGQVGNDKLGNEGFSYFNEATFIDGLGYAFGETPTAVTGLKEGLGMSASVTWERSTKYNIGFESQWFGSKLSLNADYFFEKRVDILTNPGAYLWVEGINSYPKLNLGEVHNQGVEMEMNWNHNIGEFGYLLGGMFTFSRNEIIEQGEALRPYAYMERTGHRVGQQFGHIAEGLFQSQEEIVASPTQYGTLQPGDVKYRDLNGDGKIDGNDITSFGYSDLPEIVYSVKGGISYKGFDVNVMFQGTAHATFMLGAELEYEFYNLATAMKDKHLNYWTPERGEDATYHRLTDAASGEANNFKGSSFYSRDGSYIRLKNAEIGYTFPKAWFTKSIFSSVRIYANGSNLLTWDKVKVVDPEAPKDKGQYFYPQTRIYNFGLNVSF